MQQRVLKIERGLKIMHDETEEESKEDGREVSWKGSVLFRKACIRLLILNQILKL